MADSETVYAPQHDTTQQVTSQTPATKQKNQKRVDAGKMTADKTKKSREAQKRALAEALIENNRLKQQVQANIAKNQPKQAEPPAVAPPKDETKVESDKNVLTTTQWLSVISIAVSLAGIYYKSEEIKSLLTPKKPQPPPAPPNSPVAPKKDTNTMD